MAKRRVIGVFSCEVSEKIQLNFYNELYGYAKRNGYTIMLFSASKDQDSMEGAYIENEYLYELAKNVDFAAIIIHAQAISVKELIYKAIEIGRQKEIPVFVFDREAAGIEEIKDVYKLDLDYKKGFASVVKHVIEVHGAKNIFMLAGIKDNSYSEERIAMYRQEMDAHGIPYVEEQIGYGNFWEMPAVEAVKGFLDSDLDTPEAIVCANDAMALTAIRVLNERGLRVPEDVIVTGFDGIDDGRFNCPVLTTCEPDYAELTRFVFDAIDKYNTKDRINTVNAFLIPINVYPKESCGCSHGSIEDLRMELTKLIQGLRHDSWQNHIMSHMQMAILDNTELSSNMMYMGGVLEMFKGFAHFIAVRSDVEKDMLYYGPMSEMRVLFCEGFKNQHEYDDCYSVDNIVPDWEQELDACEDEDLFLIRLLHGSHRIYGYHVERLNRMVENEIRLLDEFAACTIGIIENILRNRKLKEANDRLQDMYTKLSEVYLKDTMTGLYNRRGHAKQLEEILAENENTKKYSRIHMFSVDMDGMKYINDNFGHSEGDNAIIATAQTLLAYFDEHSICSRFGGDEFIVVAFTDDSDAMNTKTVSKILNVMVSEHPLVKGKGYPIGVSVGHSYAPINDTTNVSLLMKKSDAEMYEDKKARKAGRVN